MNNYFSSRFKLPRRFLFTFLHELGHALVDQYQLPIIGREEDAADSFAAVFLILMRRDDAIIDALNQFEVIAAVEDESANIPYWDEHELTRQRIYNIACLLYGSSPESYRNWVTEGRLPDTRAKLCPTEYEQAKGSWAKLLVSHINSRLPQE